MRRKEVTLQSPVRLLDRAIRGGLGKGNLGVITGPPGVGKSALLVQLGLDALMRDRPALHVAVGQSVEHVAAWYDAVFDDLAVRHDLADRVAVRASAVRRRLIWSVGDGCFGPRGLEEALDAFAAHLAITPSVILIDGFDRDEPRSTVLAGTLKAAAASVEAELWMTVSDAHAGALAPRAEMTPEPDALAASVDVCVFLEPHGRFVRVTVVKDRPPVPAAEIPVVLDAGMLRLRADAEAASPAGEVAPRELPPDAFTLLASGSAGAEEEFGACAERWGVHEVNFTFRGRPEIARTRGLVELSDDELRVGEVSAAYVRAHMHRAFPESEAFGHVLQAIWHQVSSAGEVFSVGTLNPDKTAHGGTGWAVELARHWGKPVHLFDQERTRWFRWDARDWVAEEPPTITRLRFAGAGTRSLSDDGRSAIRGLFERSFGAAPVP